jgi:hypothetical protein
MNTERLLKLADYLEAGQLLHKKFDFTVVNGPGHYHESGNVFDFDEHGCGTAGCAIGELVGLFPDSWAFFKDETTEFTRYSPALKKFGFGGQEFLSSYYCINLHVAEFFDITVDLVEHFFYPGKKGIIFFEDRDFFTPLTAEATPQEVASNIRKTLEYMQVRNIDKSYFSPSLTLLREAML